jgi:hypothetical protein
MCKYAKFQMETILKNIIHYFIIGPEFERNELSPLNINPSPCSGQAIDD